MWQGAQQQGQAGEGPRASMPGASACPCHSAYYPGLVISPLWVGGHGIPALHPSGAGSFMGVPASCVRVPHATRRTHSSQRLSIKNHRNVCFPFKEKYVTVTKSFLPEWGGLLGSMNEPQPPSPASCCLAQGQPSAHGSQDLDTTDQEFYKSYCVFLAHSSA